MNECIFCKIINGDIPSKKVYEDDNVFAFLDINPKVNGHTLLIPKKHVSDFIELDNDELNKLFNVAKKLTPGLMKATNAKAFTMGCNYGDSQLVKHFHIHLLPDYGLNNDLKDIDSIYEEIKKIEF